MVIVVVGSTESKSKYSRNGSTEHLIDWGNKLDTFPTMFQICNLRNHSNWIWVSVSFFPLDEFQDTFLYYLCEIFICSLLEIQLSRSLCVFQTISHWFNFELMSAYSPPSIIEYSSSLLSACCEVSSYLHDDDSHENTNYWQKTACYWLSAKTKAKTQKWHGRELKQVKSFGNFPRTYDSYLKFVSRIFDVASTS